MADSFELSGGNEASATVYLKEYAKLVLFFALVFVLISIASFHPQDASFVHNSFQKGKASSEYGNFFGSFGANLAEWVWQLFGIGGVVFSFVFCAHALTLFRVPKAKSRFWLRAFGYPQFIVAYLGFVGLALSSVNIGQVQLLGGGYFGHIISHASVTLIGKPGSYAAFVFLMLASLPLCLGIRPTAMVAWLFPNVREFFKSDLETNSTSDAGNLFRKEALEVPEIAQRSAQEFNNLPLREPYKDNKNLENSKIEKQSLLQTSSRAASLAGSTCLPAPVCNQQFDVVNAKDFEDLVGMLRPALQVGNGLSAEELATGLRHDAAALEEKLSQFGVLGRVLRSQPGPVVNVHEFEPAAGIKVTKVLGLQDDLALGLKAQSVLMAPQPGKSTIGIEMPTTHREVVTLRDILQSDVFRGNRAPLPMAIGSMVDGSPLVADLASMPHLLVAGSTGSGKSVGINVFLLSLIMNRTPAQLRLILVDPKMLELSNYDGIGHLLMPVVTEPQKAAGALRWAIEEMERRYRLMKHAAVRNIAGYNLEVIEGRVSTNPETGQAVNPLPYIVVVIDELCDLMMTAPKDVEDSIQRLAQKARAAGIHLILATQRPSVDVLTGVIKANLPCRISFQVASKHDSRTIIESIGAEKLLGKGDMLFLPPGSCKLVRAHGAFVGDKEINDIADRLRLLYPTQYEASIIEEVERAALQIGQKNDSKITDANLADGDVMDEEALFTKALEFAAKVGTVSTSSIQRQFRIGYNKAARIMDRMDREGLVGPSDVAGKPRVVHPAVRERFGG